MAKLTKSEISLVAKKIHKDVIVPLIEKQNILIDNEIHNIQDDEVILSINELISLKKTYKEINDLINEKIDYLKNTHKIRFEWGNHYEFILKKYKSEIARKNINAREFPSTREIEEEIILSGINNLKQLIETLTNKYKNE